MSRHDDRISIRQMLDHAREAQALLKNKSFADLEKDRVLQLAVTRLVEIVGESASRITSEYRLAHQQIEWPQIIGMRNRLIHGYDVLDLKILWDTVTSDLPPLIDFLEKIIAE